MRRRLRGNLLPVAHHLRERPIIGAHRERLVARVQHALAVAPALIVPSALKHDHVRAARQHHRPAANTVVTIRCVDVLERHGVADAHLELTMRRLLFADFLCAWHAAAHLVIDDLHGLLGELIWQTLRGAHLELEGLE